MKEYLVAEILDEIAMGPFGSNIKAECFVEEGIPVLNGSNLTSYEINDGALRYITIKKAQSLGRALASRGDVIVTHRGTLGQISYIPDTSKFKNYIISQSQFRMRLNKTIVMPEYFVYYFHTPEGQWKILSNKTQTGVPALGRPTSTFKKLSIPLPSLSTQAKVVEFVHSIQRKINTNNQINDYLTELLDAKFDRMLEGSGSWSEASLLDIASYKNGLAMQKFRPKPGDSGLPVLKIRELGQGCCGADAERCQSDIDEGVMVHDGDLIFSWSGTLLLDFWAGGDAGLNQHLFKVTSESYPSWFYYMWTKHHLHKFIAMAKDRATTMGHIKRSALADSRVLIPEQGTLAELTNSMQPIVNQVITNKVECRKLSELRDALLPKLMSGEIDASKVDITQLNNHLAESP